MFGRRSPEGSDPSRRVRVDLASGETASGEPRPGRRSRWGGGGFVHVLDLVQAVRFADVFSLTAKALQDGHLQPRRT